MTLQHSVLLIVLTTVRNCWLVTATYAISQGLVQMWQTTMVMQLTNLELQLTEQFVSTLGLKMKAPLLGIFDLF